MKRIYLLCVLFCLSSVALFADEDCDIAINEAKSKYNSGNYSEAKKLFDYVVNECGSSYSNASSWSQKCSEALNPRLSVSRENVSVGTSSGSTTITVTSNREWVLQNTRSNMFSVSKDANTVTIKYYANSSSSSRSDYFDVVTVDGSKSVRVRVNQEAANVLTVSETSISCSASGTTKYLTVSSNTSWEIKYPSASMYTATKDGNKVKVTINANTTGEARSDYFYIETTDGKSSQKISLSQSAKTSSSSTDAIISVNKAVVVATAAGRTEYITVTSNTSWEIQYSSGRMYTATKEGNMVKVTVNANSSYEDRYDFFYIKEIDGDTRKKIHISQSGRTSSSSTAARLSVNKILVEASAAGTTEYITVTSKTSWEIEYSSGTMYTTSRDGNRVKVTIKANTSGEARSDYFVIKTTDDKVKKRIYLSQPGNTSSNSVSSGGGSTTTQINNCRASIEKVWVEHNVINNGVKGMKIHVKFQVDNMNGVKGWCIAWFYNTDGTPMKNYAASDYKTSSDRVGTWTTFTPSYDSSLFSDFELFIPNSEITGRGSNLYFIVDIQEYSQGTSLTTSEKQYFVYN